LITHAFWESPVDKPYCALIVRICLLLAAVGHVCPAGKLRADGGRPELILPLGHTEPVSSVALSGDGKRVLTGSEDNTAILWDTETGKPVQTFTGHAGAVRSVALSGDRKRVLTGSDDNKAILWDATTAKPIQTLAEHTLPVCSVALSGDGNRVLTGSIDGKAILWDTDTAQIIQTFQGHSGALVSVALSADGKRVLTGSSDKTAILWDTGSGEPVQTFKEHADTVNSVAISGDGKRVLTGSEDKTAILWDTETAKPVKTFEGHTNSVESVAISGDGKRVLTGSGDGTAILWDTETAKPVRTLIGGAGSAESVALSGDGKRALTGCWDNRAILWDTETAKPIQAFKGHADPVSSLALSGDGRRVVTGSSDPTATLWDMKMAKPVQTFKGHTKEVSSVALKGDGKRVLTGSDDGTAILWDAETGKPTQTFRGHADAVTSAALSGDGKRVLTGSEDNTAILWDAETGKPIQNFNVHTDAVTSVALSGDGKRVLTGSEDNTAILWDAATGKPIQIFGGHELEVSSVALSADAARVVTGSGDGTAIVWNPETAKPIQTFAEHTDVVGSVALSEDGKRVLSGSWDNTAILWDTETAKPIQTFKGHVGAIAGVALSARADFAVTLSKDRTVRFWKPGREEAVFCFLSSGAEWLFWTPEGYYTCSPNGESLIAWKIPDNSPDGYQIAGPERFRKKFYRPDMFRHLFEELDLNDALALADRESDRAGEAATTIAKALPPVVLITSPRREVEIDADMVAIESVAASVGDNPVTRMRLLLDGRPFQGNLSTFNVPQPKLGQVEWSKRVDLEPGQHTIQVIAESAVSEGRSEVIHIRRKAVVDTLPRLFVLAIGVSLYEKEDLRKNVFYAAADARKFADAIERSSKPLYREIQVVTLVEQDATRRKILKALEQLRTQSTQRDAVMIFFAGHGKRDDQNNFYFLPVDVDLDELAFTGLSEGDFKAKVKAISGRVILLLDCCHSGALIENPGRGGGDSLTDRLYLDLTSNEYGLVMMCSSRGLEKSLESPTLKSGFFTVAVVEGLEGKARKSDDGAVYFKELDAYVTERVKDLSEGKQHPLTSQATTITNIPLTKP
jgi:WD40 repeat protein